MGKSITYEGNFLTGASDACIPPVSPSFSRQSCSPSLTFFFWSGYCVVGLLEMDYLRIEFSVVSHQTGPAFLSFFWFSVSPMRCSL